MDIYDFSRSFLTFQIDLRKQSQTTTSHVPPWTRNDARIVLDSVCWITNPGGGKARRYAHGASCKTERVNVPSDIWTEPNADFVPICSDERFLMLKSYDHTGRKVMFYPPSRGDDIKNESGPHRGGRGICLKRERREIFNL